MPCVACMPCRRPLYIYLPYLQASMYGPTAPYPSHIRESIMSHLHGNAKAPSYRSATGQSFAIQHSTSGSDCEKGAVDLSAHVHRVRIPTAILVLQALTSMYFYHSSHIIPDISRIHPKSTPKVRRRHQHLHGFTQRLSFHRRLRPS